MYNLSAQTIDGMTPGRGESSALAGTLLIAGVVAVIYAWQIRQPLTSSDFTILYTSARNPPERMYEPLPGARPNMNPPQFQLAMRPLAALPLPIASGIFRSAGIVAAVACIWWVCSASPEPWTLGDVGAILAWVPMASMLSLNQVTWLLWPLLLFAWANWRRDRWDAGAIAFGIAMSVKPFLGVVTLWLIATRRWRAASVTVIAAASTYAVGLIAYGVGPFRDWLATIGRVQWSWAPMNASIEGWLARIVLADQAGGAGSPRWLAAAGIGLAAAAIATAIARTRRSGVDASWPLLMTTAILASPLGWIYYLWWVMPGPRPQRLLMMGPLLWVPWAYVSSHPSNRLSAATLGSIYFWGLLMLWIGALRESGPRDPASRRATDSAGRSPHPSGSVRSARTEDRR